jgi:hypothetical protein
VILLNILRLLIAVTAMALDITAFFLIVRLVLDYRKTIILTAFDHAGREVVEIFSDSIVRLYRRHVSRPLSPRAQLLLTLGVVATARFFLCLLQQAIRN